MNSNAEISSLGSGYPGLYLYKRIVRAKLYIDNNFASGIDLGNIADEACFSRFHFLRLFKMAYGKTPHQYLICKRIDRAKQLLAAGEPVTRVCYQVGFESSTSFAILFKRMTGVSPSTYRQNERHKLDDIASRPLKYVPGCFAAASGWRV